MTSLQINLAENCQKKQNLIIVADVWITIYKLLYNNLKLLKLSLCAHKTKLYTIISTHSIQTAARIDCIVLLSTQFYSCIYY